MLGEACRQTLTTNGKVGAPAQNTTGTAPINGAAYVFVYESPMYYVPIWRRQAELTADNAVPRDLFGSSVALDGSTALVGAPGMDSGAGAAYVFARSGSSWSQQVKLTSGARDAFGSAVAISDSTAVVGAYQKNAHEGTALV